MDTKTYIFIYFSKQYLVLFTVDLRNIVIRRFTVVFRFLGIESHLQYHYLDYFFPIPLPFGTQIQG